MEVWGPKDKGSSPVLKKSIYHEGNVLLTYGLDRLTDMLQSGGDASSWMNYIGVGSGTQAADSTQSGILSTFGTGTIGGATASRSNLGARTVQYQATFTDTDNARTIEEVALCQTNTYNASGGARSVLGTDSVGKGVNDTVNISYDVIAGTV